MFLPWLAYYKFCQSVNMVCTDPDCLPLFPRSLHARTLRILRSCLQCPAVPELCMPMLVQPGWGCGLTETPQMLHGLGVGAAAAATAVKEGEDDDDEKEGEGDGGVKRGENGGEAAGDGEGRGGAVPPCRPLPDLLAAAGDCLPGGVIRGSYPRELSFIKGSYYQRECRSLGQCVLSSPGVIPWLCDTPPSSGLNCISTWPHHPPPTHPLTCPSPPH